MLLFFSLVALSVAIAGASALAIFWPLTLVHLRDRHAEVRRVLGPYAFASPAAFRWLLSRRFVALADPSLSGLAWPAFLSLTAILAGVTLSALLAALAVLL